MRLICTVFVCALCAVSCIGSSSSIVLGPDGSGTISLEYRLSNELESLGKFDGNERWPPVPVSRADMERSLARTPGLSLISSSIKKTDKDTLYAFRLKFANPGALAAFLDASGQEARIDMEGRRLILAFPAFRADLFSPFFSTGNAVLAEFERSLSGYDFSLSLKLPSKAAFRWLDEKGLETRGPEGAAVQGAVLSFTSPMAALVLAEKPFTLELTW